MLPLDLIRAITARNALLVSGFLAIHCCVNTALAAPADSPLFLSSSVKHNIMLALDDSGSMDDETLLPTNDGALWWNTSDKSFVGNPTNGQVNAGITSGHKEFDYLFPNGKSSSTRAYGDANSSYAIPPLPQYGYLRSADYNKAYYDPSVTYAPWLSYGSVNYGNVSATAAPSNPSVSAGATFDVTVTHEDNGTDKTFRFYDGMKIPSGTKYYDGSSWKTASSEISITSQKDYGVAYYPATYYTKKTTGSYKIGATTYQCSATPNPAHYTSFHNSPGSLVSTDTQALGPDGSCLVKTQIAKTDTVAIQNFANWFSYYRKRHLAMRGSVVSALSGISGVNVGMFAINKRVDVTMLDIDTATNRNDLYKKVYEMTFFDGTPNREAVKFAGEQYMRTNTGKPITQVCQKCFTILFTDGYANKTAISGLSITDSGKGAPYQDNFSGTLADIAINYYSTNLRSDLTAGKVVLPNGCKTTPHAAWLDCNPNLHMNFYGVGLGLTGTVFGKSPYLKVEDAYSVTPTWPDPNVAKDATQVDDFYHAAVNGRGELLSASSPAGIAKAMGDVLNDIVEKQGSAAAVSFSAGSLGTDTNVFQARFNSTGWSGDLVSYPLSDTTGEVQYTPNWSAQEKLDQRTSANRVILTNNGGGKAFQWLNLSPTQKADLNTGPAISDGNGEARLNYLRGVRSNESPSGLKLRKRSHLLGDVIDSGPVYVGKPKLNWPDLAPFPTGSNAYSTFVTAKTARTPVVYVGANDGMLHGFNANSGEEVLAYVPGQVYSASNGRGLHYLTDPLYTHRYYVDLSPTVSDAFFAHGTSPAAWRTVLIGGLRGGGKGYFALDVTDPTNFGEDGSKPANTVLWEFNHAELGYSFSRPSISLMNNGRWAAIFGNGYDSGAGSAQLFIVYLDGGGTDYLRLDTKVGSGGSNGIASPAVIDTDGNGTADRVYAGDQLGNMWAFDLSDANAANWAIAYKQGSTPKPLFTTAANQPITSQPVVAKNPWVADSASNKPNVLVMFGTGQYMNNSDLSVTAGQSFYGVWDNGTKELTPTNLVEQTAVSGLAAGNRVFTNNSIPYDGNGPAQRFGWYVKLADSGERAVGTPFLRGKVVYFNTTVPSTDACGFGGYSWLMRLDFSDGSSPESPVFDRNRDGNVNAQDLLDGKSVAGQKGDGALLGDSGVIGNSQLTVDSGSNDIRRDQLESLPGNNTGRMSWQEVLQ